MIKQSKTCCVKNNFLSFSPTLSILAIKGFRTISIRNAFESFFSFLQKNFAIFCRTFCGERETQRFTSNFCWISRKALVMNTKFLSCTLHIMCSKYSLLSRRDFGIFLIFQIQIQFFCHMFQQENLDIWYLIMFILSWRAYHIHNMYCKWVQTTI